MTFDLLWRNIIKKKIITKKLIFFILLLGLKTTNAWNCQFTYFSHSFSQIRCCFICFSNSFHPNVIYFDKRFVSHRLSVCIVLKYSFGKCLQFVFQSFVFSTWFLLRIPWVSFKSKLQCYQCRSISLSSLSLPLFLFHTYTW